MMKNDTQTTDTNKANLTLTLPAGLRSFAEYRAAAVGLAAAQLKCSPNDIDIEFPRRVLASRQVTVIVRPAGAVAASQNKHTAAWTRLWTTGAALAAVMVLASLWHAWGLMSGRSAMESQTALAMDQIAMLKKSQSISLTTPKQSDPLAKATAFVMQDLNVWLSVIEGTRVPQVSLKQLTLDPTTQTAQVGYELNQTLQVTPVGEALASANASLEWTLKNLSEKQAVWQGQLKK